MRNQLKIALKSPKFMIGFSIFIVMLLVILIYPLINKSDPLAMSNTMFQHPGKGLSLIHI